MPQPVELEEASASLQNFYIAADASLAEPRPRTLKHGDTFALFGETGDIAPAEGKSQGLYHDDTRFLSLLRFSIERRAPLLLSSTVRSNNAVLDVDLTNPDFTRDGVVELAKDTVHISRTKFLWNAACYELLAIRNFGEQRLRIRVAFEFDADFVDLFEVRGFTRRERGAVRANVRHDAALRFDYASLDGVARATEIHFTPAPTQLIERRAIYDLDLAPKQRAAITISVHCRVDEAPIERRLTTAIRSARRAMRSAGRRSASVETSSSVTNEVLGRAIADITMLVTDTPHGPYPYAGVPWFSTAFGRDGIITAIEMLWIYPSLARGVLRFLAANQATEENPLKDSEPGKIMHETRRCELARLGEVPFERYYGSVDSTPLFIALAGLYWQYTEDRETLQAIWPNIKAAFAWIDRQAALDADGFVAYRRRADSGLANQGWKDSGDAVFHADGRLADPPIALCEVQGYVYMARVMGAQLAEAMGEPLLTTRLTDQARRLRERFDEVFWDDALGMFVLALDGARRPCAVRTSNAGHTLFTGIADPARARRMAEVFTDREFLTGWGLRTVSSRERRYNPASYHNGSIWPHDNALVALGLARYGHSDEVARLTTAMFDAAAHMDLRRLPELFCGIQKRRDKGPILYPVACAPQAWAAAAPFALLQACLGLETDARQRVVRLKYPRLPDHLDTLVIRDLPIADARLDLVLRRHGDDVAVNIARRRGEAEVIVLQR
jgi:glycogen debranching enzyme